MEQSSNSCCLCRFSVESTKGKDKQQTLKKWSIIISMTYSPINTSFEAIKHQLTIVRFGDSLDKKGIGITPDPFGVGAYTVRVEIFEVYKFSWISWYTPYP